MRWRLRSSCEPPIRLPQVCCAFTRWSHQPGPRFNPAGSGFKKSAEWGPIRRHRAVFGYVVADRNVKSAAPVTGSTAMAKPPCDIRSLAQAHTEDAIKTLAEITKQADASAAARVSAAIALLDRGWGKSTQPISPDADPLEDA